MKTFPALLRDIRACSICEEHLPLGPRPVLQVHPDAKLLIAGQAPGSKVHETGIPFDDPSGKRLREWLGVTREEFYDPSKIAILPMGFCFPGTGKSGDLPPRPECADEWREKVLSHLTKHRSTVVLGKYAQDYHFGQAAKSVTELVKSWRDHWPDKIPLPHPSPRNNIWLRKHAWFEAEVLPALQKHVAKLMVSK